MSKFPPAFQFYASEFISDINVALMTNQQLGCYIKLICYCWIEGSIPVEIDKLSRLCGEPNDVMAQLWLAIQHCFSSAIGQPSRLVHNRLEKERKKQEEFRSERSKSGQKGAKARWDKGSEGDGSAIAQPMAEPMANDGSSSLSLSLSIKDLKTLDRTGSIEPVDKKNEPSFFEDFWSAYPVKVAKKKALVTWKRLKLDKKSAQIIADIEKRKIEDSGWLGGFVPHPTTYLNQERWNDDIKHDRPKISGRNSQQNPTFAEIWAVPEAGEHGNSSELDQEDISPI